MHKYERNVMRQYTTHIMKVGNRIYKKKIWLTKEFDLFYNVERTFKSVFLVHLLQSQLLWSHISNRELLFIIIINYSCFLLSKKKLYQFNVLKSNFYCLSFISIFSQLISDVLKIMYFNLMFKIYSHHLCL